MLALITLRMRDFILKLTTLAFGEAMSVLAFNWDYIGGANSFTGITLYTTAAGIALGGRAASRSMSPGGSTRSRLGFAARAVAATTPVGRVGDGGVAAVGASCHLRAGFGGGRASAAHCRRITCWSSPRPISAFSSR